MSLVYSYVIPYTADSNFDEISVFDALEEYLTTKYMIRFDISVSPFYFACIFCCW